MSRTFIQLAQALVSELGEGSLTSVESQTGNMANLVTWVADADVYIQGLWADWSYLWVLKNDLGDQLIAGADTLPPIPNMQTPQEKGFVLHPGTVQSYAPTWMPWRDFQARFARQDKRAQPRPTNWTVLPDGQIQLSAKVSVDTPWSLEYYRQPARLVANTDKSPIGDAYDRSIICRAAMTFGVREDAPEILSGYSAEFADYLSTMEGFYLPGNRGTRRSANNALPEPDYLGKSGFDGLSARSTGAGYA